MIIIVGESGSGKTSIAKELVKNHGYKSVISYTTRPPREGEINGIDYNFVSDDKFSEITEADLFVETAEYNGWSYGSMLCDYGEKTVAVMTPSGMRKMREILSDNGIECVVWYIGVPRRDRLIMMLQRGDNIEEAYRRNLCDVGQFDGIVDEADCTIWNNDYKISVEEIANLIA